MDAETYAPDDGLVTVYLTNATRTSAGPGPGVKRLPPDEAGRLTRARHAVYGSTAPRGFEDGGALPAQPNMMPQGADMSQYPRRVLSDLTLMQGSWPWFVRRGTVVDVVPGSALESWYGASNLTPVITGNAISDAAAPRLSKEALAT